MKESAKWAPLYFRMLDKVKKAFFFFIWYSDKSGNPGVA
jgi:hypothetical protein